MLKSRLVDTKEAHLAVLEDYKKQVMQNFMVDYRIMMIPNVMIWGEKMFLRQVALRIYDNFHKPSWQTLKHHLLRRKPKEIV